MLLPRPVGPGKEPGDKHPHHRTHHHDDSDSEGELHIDMESGKYAQLPTRSHCSHILKNICRTNVVIFRMGSVLILLRFK
jgi:hypothetical protein